MKAQSHVERLCTKVFSIGRPRRAAPTFTLRVSNSSAVNVGVALRGHPIVDFLIYSRNAVANS